MLPPPPPPPPPPCNREARQPMNDIVQVTFPILQNLLMQIIENNLIEAAQVSEISLFLLRGQSIMAGLGESTLL